MEAQSGQRGRRSAVARLGWRWLRRQLVRQSLTVALAVLDVAVFAPLVLAVRSELGRSRPMRLTALFVIVVAGVAIIGRWVSRMPLCASVRGILLGVLLMASGLAMVHRLSYPGLALFNPAWIGEAFRSLREANAGWQNITQDILILLFVAFLWWRGLRLARLPLRAADVGFRFRVGVVMLAVSVGLADAMVEWPVSGFVFLYVLAGLLAIALTRAQETDDRVRGKASSFGLGWVLALTLAAALVLALAAGLTALLTGENVLLILRPLWSVVRVVLIGIAYGVSLIVHVILVAVLWVVDRLPLERLRRLSVDVPRVRAPELSPWREVTTVPPESMSTVRSVGVVVGVLVVIGLVAFSLRRRNLAGRGGSEEERDSVWAEGGFGASLAEIVKAGAAQAGDALAVLRRRAWAHLAALDIRRAYAQMASLAARQGHPREEHQTPFEHLPALDRAFPGHGQDVRLITQAYVAIRYGEMPETAEQLTQVRQALGRLLSSFGRR